ncbi:ABC transporter substrate-binding protein [Microvirga lotononidis]|uniref:Periplasmic component of amino acid ABC-type transporter/signal transduction system n=1 Tax=Microvirga lotononidis TaxID=864069 RepID=I4YYG3_9HYPH|nr:ABC transporter substrate-binding protein [Microvirga lotononidis]EIM29005.1 periplasmic component of amino acid ABC-type transporter/signal transduction system [Microvirga lotononidis]WQO31308.1 ABC transporter substrate-binding protein [Microvirga lotononidis]
MLRKLIKYSLVSAVIACTAPAVAQDIPVQKRNETIRALLPESIRERGYLVAVNSGSYPPYEIVMGPNELQGASNDFATAFGQLFGVEVRHQTVGGLAAMLAGFDAGRYDMSVGPTGDFPDRRSKIDFIDWVQEYVAFAVQKGNPRNIQSLDDVCGLTIAVMAAGSAERVLKAKAENCAASGKPLTVQSFPDQNASILAVRSKRSDAFFSGQAPLTYFVGQSPNVLDLAAANLPNGFGDIYQGGIAPKGSAMSKAMLAAFQELFDNGTYATIMKKWGLERNMLKKPGINLAPDTEHFKTK